MSEWKCTIIRVLDNVQFLNSIIIKADSRRDAISKVKKHGSLVWIENKHELRYAA